MSLFSRSPEEFDPDSYLARIGYTGDRAPSLQTLQAIALRHPISIPFENLDAFLRRPIELDPASLQRKLVDSRRGGWCFEHNILLGHALTSLGFKVTGLAARVVWDAPPDVVRPRSHMVLLVRVPGDAASAGHSGDGGYLVDAGFGGLTLTGVLRFAAGIEQETPHEPFRLEGEDSTFTVQAKIRGEWKVLYRFDTNPQALADYEVSNWYLCHHPASHFLSTLIAARVEPDRRYALRNTEVAVHHRDGRSERRTLSSAREMRQVLDDLFHVDVPAGRDVDGALGRVIQAAT